MRFKNNVCVVIPCYKVKKKIINVLKRINYRYVDKVIVVDDFCPENSGKIAEKFSNKKVEVIYCESNLGVGGATMYGFKKAIKENFKIIFKIDGDGQHDPVDIKKFLTKFNNKNINFCKGTRFDNKNNKKKIPGFRLFGNIILTKISRITCKNENLTDVVNGFLAIRSNLLKKLNLEKISKDFFFEEDLLFHISFYEKKICEIPIKTFYFGKSSLSPFKTILPFLIKHLKNFSVRIYYDFTKQKI